ncbi:hypothetical protein GDO86_006744 [Hymenochirus boettgeri]|uniref:Uncharacterized protein n=1 Tax=Hymenochirus boettgeri TaxID=247094 RepID=A0A8T2JBP8_9PIPI|nr:hypothetical protein GDO86_006744 [Hymenochirus boettgeri]
MLFPSLSSLFSNTTAFLSINCLLHYPILSSSVQIFFSCPFDVFGLDLLHMSLLALALHKTQTTLFSNNIYKVGNLLSLCFWVTSLLLIGQGDIWVLSSGAPYTRYTSSLHL